MDRKVNKKIVLLFLFAGVFLCYAEVSAHCGLHYYTCPNGSCVYYDRVCDGNDDCGDYSEETFCNPGNCHPTTKFLCVNWQCTEHRFFCDHEKDCSDNSDERYCNIHFSVPCPPGWHRCPNGKRCIPFLWVCNGLQECEEISEEDYCNGGPVITPDSIAIRSTAQISTESTSAVKSTGCSDLEEVMEAWFSRKRTPGFRLNRWGSQVHRVAVTLHLANESTFVPGNSTGEEIRTELTMQLHRIGKDKGISSQELALYIHALLVACMNPRDFYGNDLVRDLRKRVEASGNYTNPFHILVLCNAGEDMTDRDVERVTSAYDSQYRPFWTDYEALACMALSCISSRSEASVDQSVLENMLLELKKRQFKNGMIYNFRTTALVTQALFIHDSHKEGFDFDSAIKVLEDGLIRSSSFLDSYYALPVLNRKSLLNVTSGHCRKKLEEKEEASQKTLDVNRETNVFLSVLMGEEVNGGRTWRVRVFVNSTVYDAIETLAKIDNKQKVEYNVVNGKPYIRSLNGKEDDPEMGIFWFVYLKIISSDKDPKIAEQSPVDIKVLPNQEIILWYKRAPWSDQSRMQKSKTSP